MTPILNIEKNEKEEPKIFEIILDKNRKFIISFIKFFDTATIKGCYEDNSFILNYKGNLSLKELKKYKTFRAI